MSDSRFMILAVFIGLNVAMACLESNLVAPFNAGCAVVVAFLLADVLFNKENGRWR